MTRYSIQPRDWIFVKDNEFLSFARNIGKNIGKDINKNLISKYSRRLLDHAKQSPTDSLLQKEWFNCKSLKNFTKE